MADSVAKEKDKLVHDFNEVVADAEQLLKAVASASGDKAQVLRASVEESLQAARARLAELERKAVEQSRAAARVTDAYVRDNPWSAVGIAAAAGAAAGLLIGLLLNRSR
ncbi:MAG TPA: DUF883 family protein [Usitatibacter sp.]|jgi:ElaB/YqjD/DUF883 family membrane-anchored ribosome-binding protein|nr:DUF883 family protein [Usitatibacter sp.]